MRRVYRYLNELIYNHYFFLAMQSDHQVKICCFCKSDQVTLQYKRQYHQFLTTHGPFDLYRCRNCGSGLTLPVPSTAQLEQLYQSFDTGMNPLVRGIRGESPLTSWYHQCKTRCVASRFHRAICIQMVDVGAGAGDYRKWPASIPRQKDGRLIFMKASAWMMNNISGFKWTSTGFHFQRSSEMKKLILFLPLRLLNMCRILTSLYLK